MSLKPSKVKFQIATYLAFFFGLVSGADNLSCKHSTLNSSIFDFCAKTEYEEQKLLFELQTIPTVSVDLIVSSDLSSKGGILEGPEQEIIQKSPGELKIRSKDYEELKEDDKKEEEDIKEIEGTEEGIEGTEERIEGTEERIEGEKYDRYDDKDQSEYINEYYETNSRKKCLYIEEVEIMDIFIGIYHLRKDIDAMNEEIEKESYEILPSLDNTVNEDTSNTVNEDTSNTVNEDTSNTVNEDTSNALNEDTSNIIQDTMNPEQVEKPNYVSRYLRLLRQLKSQNKQFRRRTEPVGTHKDDVLTDLQMNPPIVGSKMPDSLPIVKRRVVPGIPLDIESASYKYEGMKNEYKLKREKERLRNILDSQLKNISRLMEKHSELLSLLDKLEKAKKYIDVIDDLKVKLQLQKSKIESLEIERLELLRELLSQRINILEIKHRIASLQKKLLGNGELLYRSCIEVNINDPIIEEAKNCKKEQKYRSELKMRIGGKQTPMKQFVSCLFIKPTISPQYLSQVTILHTGDKVGAPTTELPEVTISIGKIGPKKQAERYTSRLSIRKSKGEWHPCTDAGETQESGLNVMDRVNLPEGGKTVKKSDPEPKKGSVKLEDIVKILEKFNTRRRGRSYLSEQEKYEITYEDWFMRKETADRRKEEEENRNHCKTEMLKELARQRQMSEFRANQGERFRKRKEELETEANKASKRLSALTKSCG
ncbi:hypothetical protein FG379_002078 [Cryptosporidium bovis]|uniref:uncharacterized protein n=1 Tax=Cryptosporidium bovis TaxID=310047 RepID=UPI00351A906A|nr:hypothetical protein FG379_002078 [Cryptosporidium bovis]